MNQLTRASRTVLPAAVLLLALWPRPEHAQTVPWTDVQAMIAKEAAAAGVSAAWLSYVANCETGWTGNAALVGRAGEIGPFQFHPRGIWAAIPVFRSWWDVYDVRLNIRGAAWAFAHGLAFHWSCARG